MRDKILYIFAAVAVLLLAYDIYMFTGFPPERNQGVIFKIIFFHVPMAITALTCAVVAFVASVLFLITKKFQFDALAVAVTEVGLAFLAGNLSVSVRQLKNVHIADGATITGARDIQVRVRESH